MLLFLVPRESDGGSNQKYNFNGQTIAIPTLEINTPIKDIKEMLQHQLGGLAPNKLKLSTFDHGVLRDTQTLAFYNIVDREQISVAVKERGEGNVAGRRLWLPTWQPPGASRIQSI
ncbi:hypothetical protein T484DRAFT_2125765 [Baffinella frigidus]|nr:hypothetical protein T484DRAFT_2125765 [Cryptophyta sp. CCMP2293]